MTDKTEKTFSLFEANQIRAALSFWLRSGKTSDQPEWALACAHQEDPLDEIDVARIDVKLRTLTTG